MARVVRPIAFDEKRKAERRDKARVSQKKRKEKQFQIGGEWYYPAFMQRLVREPIFITCAESNDN